MGALRPMGCRKGVERRHARDRRAPGGSEDNLVRDRAGAGCTAERAGFKVGVRSGAVMNMRRHPRHRGGAQLQRKRRAVRRHEAGRHIGAEQKQGQP